MKRNKTLKLKPFSRNDSQEDETDNQEDHEEDERLTETTVNSISGRTSRNENELSTTNETYLKVSQIIGLNLSNVSRK